MSLSIPQTTGYKQSSLIYPALFFFFLTLSMDCLRVNVGFLKFKITHAVASLFFLFVLFYVRKLVIPKGVLFIAVMIFSSLALSCVAGGCTLSSSPYLLAYLFNLCVYFLVPFSIVLLFDHEKIFKIYFFSFIIIGICACVQLIASCYGFSGPFTHQFIILGSKVVTRPDAFAEEPSFYALYMTSFVMFYNTKSILNNSLYLKNILFCNLLLLISTTTGSIAAYFFYAFILIFFSFFIKQIKAKHILIPPLVSLIFLLSVFFIFNNVFTAVIAKHFYSKGSHESFSIRITSIYDNLAIFCDHPWLGIGLGNIGPYLYEQKVLGSPIVLNITQEQWITYAPSCFIPEMLASLGFVGCIALTIFAIYLVCLVKKAYAFCKEESEKNFLLALFISLVVVLCEMQINQGLFRSYIWVHIALLIGLCYKTISKYSKI